MDKKVIYQLVQTQENAVFLVLYANDAPCNCPFQPLIPTPGPNGQTMAGRIPCNSGCPLAEIVLEKMPAYDDDEDNKLAGKEVHKYVIHCGSSALSRDVSIKEFSTIITAPSINHQ